MSIKLKAVSLFSGCGGFDWGAAAAGVNIIFANDLNSHAARAYRSLFPNVNFSEGDVRDIVQFPSADILIGCYPCTGFSVAARRKWKTRKRRDLHSNENNFLYREFIRALRQVEPKFLFVENVRGMTSASDGWFLERQIANFQKLGYEVKPKVLNACDYGVAQTRKRLFIVGVRKDIKKFQYEFLPPTHGPETKKAFKTLDCIIGDMKRWPEGEYYEAPFHGHYLTRNRKRSWREPSYTIVANANHVPLHPMGLPMRYLSKDKWEMRGVSNRRLSWRECARLQGLPSIMKVPDSLYERYRIVGNAVPPRFGEILLMPIVRYSKEK
ncbi:MAG: DNA cytosine methyltransferase [Terriglobales bacterium]